MKKLLLLFALFVSLSAGAQSGLYFSLGPMYNVVKCPTFEKFRTSYNDLEGPALKKALPKLPNATAGNWMLGIKFGGLYLAFGRDKYTAASEALGNFGEKRTFQLTANSSLFELGFLSGMQRYDGAYHRLSIGGGLCFGYNDVMLASSFTTPNGYKDFGTGSRLNGHFTNNNTDYYLVVQGGVNVYRGICLVAKFYYNVFNNNLNAPALVDHQQDDQSQTSGARWIYIPTDYKTAVKQDLDPRMLVSDGGNTLQASTNYYMVSLALVVPITRDLFKQPKNDTKDESE